MEAWLLTDKKTLAEIEARLTKLKEAIDHAIDKPSQFASYFYTEEGKTLANSIAELTDFSMKTAMLFFPYGDMMPKLKEYLRSEQAGEQILKSVSPTMSQEYRDLLADFLPRYYDLIGSRDITSPFPIKDIGRFLALHVLSLYSYIEVYADEVLDRLMNQESLLKRMVKKLEAEQEPIIRLSDLHRYMDNQEDVLIKIVRRNLPRNLAAKMDFIIATVGITDELAKISEAMDFAAYRGLLLKLINLRNTFAHGKPCPEISLLKERLDEASIQGIWRGFLKNLNINSEGPLVEAGIYDSIMEFLVEQGPMFSITITTMIIALTYPLIIDTAISVVLSKHHDNSERIKQKGSS